MTNSIDTRTDGAIGSVRQPLPGERGSAISSTLAARIANSENRPELTAFIDALEMQRPVSIDKAARLIEHFLTENTSFNTEMIEVQMRMDRWEDELSDSERLEEVAEHAANFLNTEQGIDLYNSFKKIYARTHGEMFP